MEFPSKGPKQHRKYNYSAEDVAHFFEEQNERLAIKEIIYKKDGTQRTPEEIKIRMNEIKQGNINESRWIEMNEGKIYLQKAINRYFKGKSKAEEIGEVCTLGLPEYIKEHIGTLIKEKTINHKTAELGIDKNFAAIYIEFKKIFNEHKDTPLNEKEIIKRTLKVFYNASKEFEEEFEKARIEYNDEIQKREEESDANDMYRTYETLYEPDTTARNRIYNKYFGVIDTQQRFKETNKKIFDIICKEFEKAKEIQINKEKNIANNLSTQKKEEKQHSEEEIGKLMISLNQETPSRKILIDNINPEFEEVDDEGDVIGLTKEHTPLFIIEDKDKKKDKYIPNNPFD